MPNFNPDHPDDTLLEDARMQASNNWEVGFVADMLEKRRKYGQNFELTERQRDRLEKIAYEEGGR